MFGTVRFCERNVKHHLGSGMSQRWLAAILLHAEESFKALKGFRLIPEVVQNIKQKQNEENELQAA